MTFGPDTAVAWTTDASRAVLVDRNGTVHTWAGELIYQLIKSPGTPVSAFESTGSYYPVGLGLTTGGTFGANGIRYWNDLAGRELLYYAGERAIESSASTVVVKMGELDAQMAGQASGVVGATPISLTIGFVYVQDWVVYAHELGHAYHNLAIAGRPLLQKEETPMTLALRPSPPPGPAARAGGSAAGSSTSPAPRERRRPPASRREADSRIRSAPSRTRPADT